MKIYKRKSCVPKMSIFHGKCPFIIFKMKIYKRKKMWAKNAEFVLGKFPFINFKIKTNFILYRGQSFYCRGHVTSKFVLYFTGKLHPSQTSFFF